MDVDDEAEIVECHLTKRGVPGDSGIVHHHIQPPKLAGKPLEVRVTVEMLDVGAQVNFVLTAVKDCHAMSTFKEALIRCRAPSGHCHR
jgi:hypothetical protein